MMVWEGTWMQAGLPRFEAFFRRDWRKITEASVRVAMDQHLDTGPSE
jgi:hypothetical protein